MDAMTSMSFRSSLRPVVVINPCSESLLISRIGFGIPCMFHILTGLDCPSCGISRMCMALLQLRFADAFRYNPAIFCLLPLLLAGLGSVSLVLVTLIGVFCFRERLTKKQLAAIAVILVSLLLLNI